MYNGVKWTASTYSRIVHEFRAVITIVVLVGVFCYAVSVVSFQNPTFGRALVKARSKVPGIYVVTPTYARTSQKADLTSMIQAIELSGIDVHMIIVEDTNSTTASPMLQNFARDHMTMHSNINITLLTAKTEHVKNSHHKGVAQRNKALDWITKHHTNASALVYFGDDDNTYDERLYHEFVQVGTKNTKIGLLPVGFAGGSRWEGPNCEDGVITGYHSVFHADTRTFALDMAGFAFTVETLLETGARMDETWPGGQLETYFASLVTGIDHKIPWSKLSDYDKAKVMPLADCCSHVYVWHTRTKAPSHKDYGTRLEVR